jgi:hypothetical protein
VRGDLDAFDLRAEERLMFFRVNAVKLKITALM